jgi:CheY-like chemotaxis protein
MIDRHDNFRVLLADDDPVFVGRASQALGPLATLRLVNTGIAALATVPRWKPDVILFDLLMTDLDGFTFIEEIARTPLERHPFVLCTSDGRGAGTRIRPLPDWRVGTLLRSSSIDQLQIAVLQAACYSNPIVQRWVTA